MRIETETSIRRSIMDMYKNLNKNLATRSEENLLTISKIRHKAPSVSMDTEFIFEPSVLFQGWFADKTEFNRVRRKW